MSVAGLPSCSFFLLLVVKASSDTLPLACPPLAAPGPALCDAGGVVLPILRLGPVADAAFSALFCAFFVFVFFFCS